MLKCFIKSFWRYLFSKILIKIYILKQIVNSKVSLNNGSKIYYTNQAKDTEKVNLKYYAGIKIPDGFT